MRSRAYKRKRMATDIKFKLEATIRTAVRHSLTEEPRYERKDRKTFAVLGFTVAELKAHLLKTIPSGYTWDDFLSGALHVDHKTPLAAFNFTSYEDHDFKRAWALSNLQLLPALENITKGAKLAVPFQPSLI